MGVVKVQSQTISQCLINLLPFCFTSIRPTIPIYIIYSYFEIWPWKIPGQGHGWGKRTRSHSWPSIEPMHFFFCFMSIWPTIPEIWPIGCLTLKKKQIWNCEKKNCQNIFLQKKISIIYLGNISMSKGIKLPNFAVIGWVVLILLCRKANIC